MLAFSLFLSAFLAATLLPFSSEVALVAAINSGLDKNIAFVVASFGNVLAVIFNYYLGYFLYKTTKKKVLKSKIGRKAFYLGHRYGYYPLFLSWLPIIGDPISVVAGLVKLRFIPFLIICAGLRIARYYFIIYIYGIIF
jgi:membrane protein YqaA with SNARE-associated domain